MELVMEAWNKYMNSFVIPRFYIGLGGDTRKHFIKEAPVFTPVASYLTSARQVRTLFRDRANTRDQVRYVPLCLALNHEKRDELLTKS